MRITPEQVLALMGPLNKDRVESRKQGGRDLSYLASWDVKATLIKVFGFGGFSSQIIGYNVLRMEKDVPAYEGFGKDKHPRLDDDGNPVFNWSVTVSATVRLTLHDPDGIQDAVYEEAAAASQTGPDVGEVTDFALKTAESDALKRAATYLGTQFGLSLYKQVPGGPNLSDVVRVVLAPLQREEVLAPVRERLIAERKARVEQEQQQAAEREAAARSQQQDTDAETPQVDPVTKAKDDLARATGARPRTSGRRS